MGMFELVATAELKLLFCVILYANVFRVVPANPDNFCGADLYLRVLLAHRYLLLTALTAGALLLAVKAGARAAAWAAAAATGGKAFDDDHKAAFEGIDSVAAGWKRRSLRGMLLLAVALSFTASVLADVVFQDGFLYRFGCHAEHAGYGAGAPLGVLVMGLFALMHAFFAWVAVSQN